MDGQDYDEVPVTSDNEDENGNLLDELIDSPSRDKQTSSGSAGHASENLATLGKFSILSKFLHLSTKHKI